MKKKVYICAPLGGDVEQNLKNAVRYTEYALKSGAAPVASHFYALCLDDNKPQEHALGMSAGISLLWFCDEMWIFGDEITAGMKEEIRFCKNMKIKMRNVGNGEIRKLLGDINNDKEDKLENCISRSGIASDGGSALHNDNIGSIRFG